MFPLSHLPSCVDFSHRFAPLAAPLFAILANPLAILVHLATNRYDPDHVLFKTNTTDALSMFRCQTLVLVLKECCLIKTTTAVSPPLGKTAFLFPHQETKTHKKNIFLVRFRRQKHLNRH